jgi:hypothetical protein
MEEPYTWLTDTDNAKESTGMANRDSRNAHLAAESDVEIPKRSFADRGIKVSGGVGLTANEPNGFQC